MTHVSPEGLTHFGGDTYVIKPEIPTDSSSVPTLETSDIVVPGYDEATVIETEKTSAEIVLENGLQAELKALDGWIVWRVRNELVSQIFANLKKSRHEIDIDAVHAVIKKEIAQEKDKHFQDAQYLEMEAYPDAQTRPKWVASERPDFYSQVDNDNLSNRVDIHMAVVARIDAIQETGNEGTLDLTKTYVRRVFGEAKDEAFSILAQRQTEQQQLISEQQKQIDVSQAVIDELKADAERLTQQLQDRDLALLDMSLDDSVSTLDLINQPTQLAA